jgi:hypothetical protein
MASSFDWVEVTFFPRLQVAVGYCVAIWIILIPFLAFRTTRPWAGAIYLYSSYLTGFTCWIFSSIATYHTLGLVCLLIGLLVFGIGVFPLAIIGAALHGVWQLIFELLFALALVIAPRALGGWIVGRHERRLREASTDDFA